MNANAENTGNGRFEKWRISDSIYVKCLILLAFSSAVTIGLVTFKSMRSTNMVASASIMNLGAEVVAQFGERSGPAVLFRKTDDLEVSLQNTVEGLAGSASGAIILAMDGEVLAQHFLDGEVPGPLLEAAQIALTSQQAHLVDDRLIIAMPIIYGQEQKMIGVVGIDWKSDVLYTVVAAQNRVSLAIAIGVGLVMLLIMGVLIKRMVARPLLAVASSMQEVAKGNYGIEIPKYRRGNEIGVVARALEEFKNQLQSSEETRKDAAMKSTALDAGSAAIMIADADFKIVYASRTVLELLKSHAAVIQSRIATFDPENIIGQSIDIFHKRAEMQRNMLSNLGAEGHDANLEMDDITLSLRISKIDTDEGERIGYVVEWSDVTEERLNAAILESLDENQARAEFGHDGTLVDANAAFLTLAGIDDMSHFASFADAVFTNDAPADPTSAAFQEFEIKRTDGGVSTILGGLSPVWKMDGTLKRTVLIGADITTEHQQKIAAAAARETLEAEQSALIDALSGALSSLADGDLSVRITSVFAGANDRIRADFNMAIERLEDAISSVTVSATTIRSEVQGVASASMELSNRTERQAATLEETASALAEISASVSSSAQGANNANQVVTTAQSDAHTSGDVVKNAVSAMGKIAESSSEISSIVKVIDDIAFQTNLLALNAGVEAARAGDAGRGFAVVASEVRALAQRSSEAASEISSLITASSESVDLGVTLVGNAGEALEQIISSISDISGYVSQIANASQEQSLTISEISSSMSQLDQVTQQNVAMFEETSAASQTLAAAADDLTERVQMFKANAGEPDYSDVENESGATSARLAS